MITEELYQQIVKIMPIACVDLLVKDSNDRVLLIKRKNKPAAGQWWFPGGRVLFSETRIAAAIRKLWEECGLTEVAFISELGTHDLLFEEEGIVVSHGITTVYLFRTNQTCVFLDNQSEDFSWVTPQEYQHYAWHNFLRIFLK